MTALEALNIQGNHYKDYTSQFTPKIVNFLTQFSRLKFLEVDDKVEEFEEYNVSIKPLLDAVPSLKTLAFESIQNHIDDGRINKDECLEGLPKSLRPMFQTSGYGPAVLKKHVTN